MRREKNFLSARVRALFSAAGEMLSVSVCTFFGKEARYDGVGEFGVEIFMMGNPRCGTRRWSFSVSVLSFLDF